MADDDLGFLLETGPLMPTLTNAQAAPAAAARKRATPASSGDSDGLLQGPAFAIGKGAQAASRQGQKKGVIQLDDLVRDRAKREEAARRRASVLSDSDDDSEDSLLDDRPPAKKAASGAAVRAAATTDEAAAAVAAAADNDLAEIERVAGELTAQYEAEGDNTPCACWHMLRRSNVPDLAKLPAPPRLPTLGEVYGAHAEDGASTTALDVEGLERAMASGFLAARLLASNAPAPAPLRAWLAHNALYGSDLPARSCADTIAAVVTGNPCARASTHVAASEGVVPALLTPTTCVHQDAASRPGLSSAPHGFPAISWAELLNSMHTHGVSDTNNGDANAIVHPHLAVALDLVPSLARSQQSWPEGAGLDAAHLFVTCMRLRLDDVAGSLAPSAEAAQVALLTHVPRATWYREMLPEVHARLQATLRDVSNSPAAAAWHVEALLRRGVPSSVHRGRELQLLCFPDVARQALFRTKASMALANAASAARGDSPRTNGTLSQQLLSAGSRAVESLGDPRRSLDACERGTSSYWGLFVAMRAAQEALTLHLLHAHGVSPHTEYRHESARRANAPVRWSLADDGWPAELPEPWGNQTPLTEEAIATIRAATDFFKFVEKRIRPTLIGDMTLSRVKALAGRFRVDWEAHILTDEKGGGGDDKLTALDPL